MSNAAKNLELEVYRQIRALLEANTNLMEQVKRGNQLWYDTIVGSQNPSKPNRADGDYPELELRPRGGDTRMWDDDPTFGTHADGSNCEWLENETLVYRLTLTSQLLSVGECTTLGAEARNAIREGGVRLGLPYVTGVRMRWQITRTDASDESDNMVREKTEVDIIVSVQIAGSAMTEEPPN